MRTRVPARYLSADPMGSHSASVAIDGAKDRKTPMTTEKTERMAYTVGDAAAAISISRRMLYREMAAGRLKFAKIGKRRIIPANAIREFLELAGQPTERPRL